MPVCLSGMIERGGKYKMKSERIYGSSYIGPSRSL